jgi:hypothetical protein
MNEPQEPKQDIQLLRTWQKGACNARILLDLAAKVRYIALLGSSDSSLVFRSLGQCAPKYAP